jgi:hypothetical protein
MGLRREEKPMSPTSDLSLSDGPISTKFEHH